MKIEDNFLDQEKFDELQSFMMSVEFVWHYNDRIDFGDDVDKYQFIHSFYFVITIDYHSIFSNFAFDSCLI